MGSFKSYDIKTNTFSKMLYYTVAKDGNYELCMPEPDNKSSKPIERTNIKNSICGILSSNGKLQSIQVFDEKGEKKYQIDLTKKHNGIKPHVHDFTTNKAKYHPKTARACTTQDVKIIKKIKEMVKKYKGGIDK